eukprot:5551384-Amphidinium_carterae.1
MVRIVAIRAKCACSSGRWTVQCVRLVKPQSIWVDGQRVMMGERVQTRHIMGQGPGAVWYLTASWTPMPAFNTEQTTSYPATLTHKESSCAMSMFPPGVSRHDLHTGGSTAFADILTNQSFTLSLFQTATGKQPRPQ